MTNGMGIKIGRAAYVFPDRFDLDLVCGMTYSGVVDIGILRKHVMKDLAPDFVAETRPGDLLVAGSFFPYGHFHPSAMLAMRDLGIDMILARSFQTVFFKTYLAQGMLVLPCAVLPDDIRRFETFAVDLDDWSVWREATGESFPLDEVTRTEREIMSCGGIRPYLMKKHGSE